MPQISKAQIEQAIESLTSDVGYREAITMLQSLLEQGEAQPVAYQIRERDNYDLIDAEELPQWEEYITDKGAKLTPLFKQMQYPPLHMLSDAEMLNIEPRNTEQQLSKESIKAFCAKNGLTLEASK